MNNIFVYIELENGAVADVSLELLTKGRELADELGVKLEAVVLGHGVAGIEKELAKYGADTVWVADDEIFAPFRTLPHTAVLCGLIRQEKPAAVIALGGGSAMDAAKAAYLSAQSGWPLAEHFGVNRYSERCPDAAADRVICIPTTSGTGSEATPYSNIVDPAQQVKKLIAERLIVPELALLVPELTNSMPETVTRATGCDALAHSIEGFLNVRADRANPDADGWALESIRLITENLPRAIADGRDETARRNMCIAATLGGMVIRFKPTGLPHLASYSWFGRLEHGIAVAMLLPGCWRYYLGNPSVAERTMRLAGLFPGRTPEEVIASFRRFLDSVGVPGRLSDCSGITPELLAATAQSGPANRMKLESAPRPVPVEESAQILASILEDTWQGEQSC